MRVIAGSARRLQLKTVDGFDTRPTTDRIKETLFNMIQHDMFGCSFLDLFSGSGAIGIEALSRGAQSCVFIEQNSKAVQCIKDNLSVTKLEERATVISNHVMTGLMRLEDQNLKFDYVFMDPPYDQNLEKDVLDYLKNTKLIHADSTIIIEASLSTSFDDIENMGYQLIKQKRYKTNQHVFLCKGE